MLMTMGQGMSQTMSQSLALTEGLYATVMMEEPKQQPLQIEPVDIEELINWLEELWLTDEELRKMISEDEWQKFMELVKESM